MKVLVTGGAGYIGRFLAAGLQAQGHRVVAFDKRAPVFETVVQPEEFVRANLTDRALLHTLILTGGFDAVVHCAGSWGSGPGSVVDPVRFFRANYLPFLHLAEACTAGGLAPFVYVSTADASSDGIETATVGEARWLRANVARLVETNLGDLVRTGTCRSVVLRVPTVAGAHPSLDLGEFREAPCHFIGEAVQVAVGKKAALRLRGRDPDAADGSVSREYLHVEDLVGAAILSLEYLIGGGESRTFACGYGKAYSDRTVAAKVQKLSGISFPVLDEDAAVERSFGPVTDSSSIRDELGWVPRYDDDLTTIIKTALRWERKVDRREPVV